DTGIRLRHSYIHRTYPGQPMGVGGRFDPGPVDYHLDAARQFDAKQTFCPLYQTNILSPIKEYVNPPRVERRAPNSGQLGLTDCDLRRDFSSKTAKARLMVAAPELVRRHGITHFA